MALGRYLGSGDWSYRHDSVAGEESCFTRLRMAIYFRDSDLSRGIVAMTKKLWSWHIVIASITFGLALILYLK